MIFGIRSDVDAQLFDQAASFFAVRRGTFDGIRTAEAQAKSVAHAEFIALGVAAEVVVVIEDQDAGARARRLAIEMRGREAADAAAYDDEVVSFTGILGRRQLSPRKCRRATSAQHRTSRDDCRAIR